MADADFDGFRALATGTQPVMGLTSRRAALLVRLSGGIVSLALLLGGAVWGYRLAVRDRAGVPVIQALDGPMRVAPKNPGGEIADHQGLSVNTVAAAGIAAPVPDRLVLAPRPIELTDEDSPGLAAQLPAVLDEVAAPAVLQPETALDNLALAAAPAMESASPIEVAVDAALAEALGLSPGPEAQAEEVGPATAEDIAPADAIMVSPRPRPRPVQVAAQPVPATILPEVTEIDPADIPLGTRLVQFGAFDSTDDARAGWVMLQGRFPELMAGKAMVLQPAEGNGRTFWRLRAHGFADEAESRRFCIAFIAEDLICIPVPQR